jgi:hypothetical protein
MEKKLDKKWHAAICYSLTKGYNLTISAIIKRANIPLFSVMEMERFELFRHFTPSR